MESPFLNSPVHTKEDKKEEKSGELNHGKEDIKEKDSKLSEKVVSKQHPKGEIIIEDILAPVIVIPPSNFAMVAKGVYRSGYPVPKNFPFLKKLGLKSIL